MATTYLRLFPAVNQFELENGQLNVAGQLKVFYEGTDDLADIYDEDGTQLAQPAILDSDGRAPGLFVDSSRVYRLEVYDRFGALIYTVRKMTPVGGGAGSAMGNRYNIVSSDNSVDVDTFDNDGVTTFDLSAQLTQVQSDWTQSDTAEPSYILNKPTEIELVAGENITFTESVGALTISATDTEQVNSDWDANSGKAQILHRPNLATVATSGSYNDLTDKPSIPSAQVNSDWNANSGVSEILNKPTLAAVATSGDYNDLSNKPTIPQGVPSYTASDAYKSLSINDSGDGIEWAQKLRGVLTESDGQGGTTTTDIRNLRINTNVGSAGMVRVTPVGGSVKIIGFLTPDYGSGDESKILCVNSDASDLEWAYPPYVKHDAMRTSSWAWMNPYTEEYPIFGGEMTFKMEWASNGGSGPSAMTPYLKGKVVTASNWTAYIHVSKGASGGMTYQETSIVHGTANNTYVDLSQCDYGNGFSVAANNYPMVVNMDIMYVKGANNYAVGHLTWLKTDDWVFLRTTYDG